MLPDDWVGNPKVILAGPPGSGKTRRLIDFFNGARKNWRESSVLFIVPDSGAREHVRDIIARNPPPDLPHAFCDNGIHSLQSLVRWYAGSSTAGISHIRVLITKWIDDGKFDLDRYTVLNTPGGRNSLARAINSIRSNDHSHASIKDIPASILPKDSPLKIGMALWDEWLKDSGKSDDRDILLDAIEKTSEKTWDIVLIDGFTEFRPLQWKLIENIVEKTERAAVAIDPGQIPSHELYKKFIDIGFDAVELDPGSRWENCADLSWLADVELWEIHSCKPDSCPEKPSPERLKIIRAGNPQIEASQIAREVSRCIDGGYSYGDIAILAPSLVSMYPALQSEFSHARIPIRFFLEIPLAETGPGMFLNRVLAILCGDWDDNSVCELLSSPMSGITDEDVSNARYVTSSKYRLGNLDAWLRWAGTDAGEKTKGLFGSLSTLITNEDIDPIKFTKLLIETIAQSIRESWRRFPDDLIADEGWAWRAVGSCLTRSAMIFKDIFSTSSPAKIAAFLRSELEQAKGKPLDRRQNCVNAVTLLGARTWGVKVAMVCGLSRNYFPHKPSKNPFLPDQLRKILDPPLPTYDELKEREEALFRIASTRASDRLVISWSANDSSGSPQLPSCPVEKCIDWILDGETPETIEHDPPKSLSEAVFGSDIASLALENHLDDSNLISSLSEKTGHRFENSVRDEHFENPVIHQRKNLVRAALGSLEKPISPTDLNNLAQCPYRFFAKRVLGLKNPDRDKVRNGFDNLQWGSIAHDALSEWSRGGKTDDFEPLVRKAFSKCRELTRDSLSEARIGQIVDVLNRFAEFESDYWPDGFTQVESELVFDTSERRERMKCAKGYDPVEFQINEELMMILSGRIDRLDLKDEKYAMVSDYKRSSGAGKTELEKGNELQLAGYIALVRKGLGYDVALACFLPLKKIDGQKKGDVITDTDLLDKTESGFFKTVDDLTIDGHLEAAKNRIADLVGKLSTGDITPNPTTENKCGRKCDYHDLCRFKFSGDEGSSDDGGET